LSVLDLYPAEILTERLRLRAPKRGDVTGLHEAIAETLTDLVPWLPWARADHGPAETRRYLRAARSAWSRQSAFEFLIEVRESQRLAGVVSLHRVDWVRAAAGLGYWVRRTEWNRGVATEAATAALDHALHGLRLHRIEALVALENKASQRVIEKLGFVREGVAREAEFVDGRYLDHIQYSFLRSDLPPAARGAAR
jgi:ribosomal-protein-serine acetyltransferase